MTGDNIPARGSEAVVVSSLLYVALVALVGIIVFDRLYSKCTISVNGLLVLLAIIPTSIFYIATPLTNVSFDWGRHTSDISSQNLETGYKMVFAAEIFYVLSCVLAKLSIMMLAQGVMSCASAFWRGLVVIAVIFVSVQGLISCLLVLFQCGSPMDFYTGNRDSCATHSSTPLASNVLNILTDIVVFSLSILCILSYQLSPRQKSIFFAIYGMGIISIVAGVLRTHYLLQAAQQDDFSWAYYPVWMTSAFQLYFGMICATLPATQSFLSNHFPAFFGPLMLADQDPDPPRRQSVLGNISSGEEELLDFEKTRSDAGGGVVIATGTPGLSDEDKEYIKITQQTVVQISRVGQV